METVSAFFGSGFMHLAPIVLTGIFAMAIVAERVRALFLVYPIKDEEGFFERIGN